MTVVFLQADDEVLQKKELPLLKIYRYETND